MLTASSLSALPGIRHGFFTREGGVSRGIYESLNGGLGSSDDKQAVVENRARMAASLGVSPARMASVYQIHSPDAVTVDESWDAATRPKADALVTATPGVALCVTTADCGPVLFADPQASVIGAAHAGWRGAFGGVIESTIAAMEKLGAQRERTLVAMGPMIRKPNYEVGMEFMQTFIDHQRGNVRFFAPGKRADRMLFDLPAYIVMRLGRAGLRRIEDLGHCTYGDPARFFSYRRSQHRSEPDYGRHVNAIALGSR